MSVMQGPGDTVWRNRGARLRERKVTHSRTGIPYYYREGVVIVPAERVDDLRAALRRAKIGGKEVRVTDIPGSGYAEVTIDRKGLRVDALVEDLGADLEAEPDYVAFPGTHVKGFAAARPSPYRAKVPPRPRKGRGAGVVVGVVDLAFFDPVEAGHPSWATAGVFIDAVGPVPRNDRIHPPYVGHGNAVIGIVKQLAPDATVVAATIPSAPGDTPGITSDRALAAAIERILCRNKIHILVIPFGGSTRHGVMPLTEAALEPYLSTTAVYASAGNDGLDPTTYPAVDPDVFGVGAWSLGAAKLGWTGRACRTVLRPDAALGRLGLAKWSNRGAAAALGAAGIAVPAPFVTGDLRIRPGTGDRSGSATSQRFDGWGLFTGTSFAAAVAAGCHAVATC